MARSIVSGLFRGPMHTVFIFGDSTAAPKKDFTRPETGWGEKFSGYLKAGYQLDNRAINGRSTKDAISRGEFSDALLSAKAGDIALIQYGHNDEKLEDESRGTRPWLEFVDNLLYMADELKKKGVKVVFITSIARRRFVSGKLQDTHGDWIAAMKYAAWKAEVPCIDMTIPTMVGIAMMGDEESKRYFMNFGPGRYINYPEGKEDDTHLSPEGAEWIARLVAERLMDVEDCCESY